MGIVLVPEGEFTSRAAGYRGRLSAFCIDRTEVTVRQYRRCVNRRVGERCTPAFATAAFASAPPREIPSWDASCNWRFADREDHPINCVDWAQAQAYCRLTGKRLPTRVEWEYAATGGDGREYPWGNERPNHTRLNACGSECRGLKLSLARGMGVGLAADAVGVMYEGDDGWPTTAPVGNSPLGESPFHALDMAGNVGEWTADSTPGDDPPWDGGVRRDPPPVEGGDMRTVSGHDWSSDVADDVARGHFAPPQTRQPTVGVRCACGPTPATSAPSPPPSRVTDAPRVRGALSATVAP